MYEVMAVAGAVWSCSLSLEGSGSGQLGKKIMDKREKGKGIIVPEGRVCDTSPPSRDLL